MNKHKKLISLLLAMIIILGIAVNVSAKSGIFVGIVSSGGIGITASTGDVHWKHDDHLRHMEDYIDDLSGYSDIPIHAGYFTKAQVLSFLDT
ncbi:MAG: hypothetical protein IIX77_04155, partial [Oscillospiraceae bacterium]|nr:hypothetical protein [Oscillospiraceae bacterium]